MKTTLISALALLFLATAARAATLPGGEYRCTANFGDILLAGRYPFSVNGQPGSSMDLQTAHTGVVTGTVSFFGEKEEAIGAIRVRDNGVRLMLRGKVDAGRISVKATLQGDAFIGTATLKGRTSPIRLDVAGIAPIRAAYVLALTSPANGRIAGSGVVRVEQMQFPVKATGLIVKGKVSLTLKAGKTRLKATDGTFTSQGFVATTWIAQGFGALRRGQNLKVDLVP